MKRGKDTSRKLTMAVFKPVFRTTQDRAGATGIRYETIINYLSLDTDIKLKLVSVETVVIPNKISVFFVFSLLKKLLRDIWIVIKEDADILLLSYPGIPLVPLTSNMKFPLAFLTYLVLWVKNRLFGQTLVVLIPDLPIEQTLGLNYKKIKINIRIFNLFERLLFRAANKLIAISPMFIDLIIKKHHIPIKKFLLYKRHAYMPNYTLPSKRQSVSLSGKVKIYYAGDLRRQADISNLLLVFKVMEKHPEAAMYLCGRGGEWIKELGLPNVTYLGLLDYADFDVIAGNCDIALMVYPNEHYYNLTPTYKYSAYVANGLAILSTNTTTVARCIVEDGVGVAVPMKQLGEKLGRWIENPNLFRRYKKRAIALVPEYRRGEYIRQWFEEVKKQARYKQ